MNRLAGHDAVLSCLGFPPEKPKVTGYLEATKVRNFGICPLGSGSGSSIGKSFAISFYFDFDELAGFRF